MNKNLAKELLELALELHEQGETEQAIATYEKAIQADEMWSVPHYNLGLVYKYQGEWNLSYQHNKRAVALDPENEAAWWNLGIAATVLLDWRTAREAWNHFDLNLEVSDEELTMDLSIVPVRLNPDHEGEVVWCKRIDPARAIIYNVPLAACGHRFGDIVLNDGAPEGYRIRNGKEVPVFNELQLLAKSAYSTYSIVAYTEKQQHIDKLDELCHNANVEFEDWSTIRILCKQCSEGTPHETHDHDLKAENNDEHHIGFASISKDVLTQVLVQWRTITLYEHSDLKLELNNE
ncbi:tetratricopeptide repeat protein [Mucilaginibacter sp. HC2]|uniref:tetratricopeptide repeat protein n=1 Tax=Mucilaginibacter inviolabilis TaxID=2714892 RepID=UPI00140BA5E3|nr:tetratricopeptide repeat protein [Mucilaginibacter inviolabilis]NHA06458.1 tetratricopeptide repeat protein [Mucilaginibacter inviolabilis]